MKSRMFMLFSLVVVSAVLLAACGGGTSSGGSSTQPTKPPAISGDAKAGETKYQGTCASCHGLDAKGLPSLGKDLTASTFAKGLSDAELVAFVTKGRPPSDPANTTGVDMPAKGGNPALAEKDLYDIVAYLRTLEQ